MAARACLILCASAFVFVCAETLAQDCTAFAHHAKPLTDNGKLLYNENSKSNSDKTVRTLSDTPSNRTLDFASGVNDTISVNFLQLWDSFPKVIVPRKGASEQCRRDSEAFLKALDKLELWALKMFDATAKLPSGILSGNGNQYGDFDECLSVAGAVQGKYCLASVHFKLEGSPTLDHIDFLIHSGHYIRSNLTNMGHRVPRYTSILWGVCIPNSCSSYDLEEELSERLEMYGFDVKVHNTMCSDNAVERPFSFGKALTISIFLGLALLLLIGTAFDDGTDSITTPDKILNAFSLRRNVKELLDTSSSSGSLKGVEGMRGMNALALLVVHKSMAICHTNMSNKAKMAENLGLPWTVIGRTAIIYTDSFLYLSGLLNGHNLFNELKRKGTIDIKSRIISRLFRLAPLYFALMLFCTYILPDVNNGPQWNLVVEEHSRVCQQNMWKSFLFIHNFFGFENMCLTHTHQIGMDLQLYIGTLPLAWLIWKRPKLGWLLLVTIAALSTALRYLVTYTRQISMVVYYGITVQKLLDAARFSYILPTHRATIYLIGVSVAYFFMSEKSKLVLSKASTRLFWVVTPLLGLWTAMHPWKMGVPTYEYEPGPAADFAAFAPIYWGIFLAMLHWGVWNNHAASWLEDFSNCRAFKLFNKIAYSVYLTQFPIYFYNVGVQRQADYYKPINLFYLPEILSILAISTFTTLTVEMPFNHLHRIFFGKDKERIKEK